VGVRGLGIELLKRVSDGLPVADDGLMSDDLVEFARLDEEESLSAPAGCTALCVREQGAGLTPTNSTCPAAEVAPSALSSENEHHGHTQRDHPE
jgi:hypothetical protein